jgi:carbonic anhydrase
VIAVLLQQGKANSTLAEIRARMPKTEGDEQALLEFQTNAFTLSSQDMYDTYAASLTRPPCSEGMTWFVLKTPVDISAEQIDTFARLYPDTCKARSADRYTSCKGRSAIETGWSRKEALWPR